MLMLGEFHKRSREESTVAFTPFLSPLSLVPHPSPSPSSFFFSVPYWGTEKFTRSIGGTIEKTWHAWMSNSIDNKGAVVAGYALKYKDFQVVTIKGALW